MELSWLENFFQKAYSPLRRNLYDYVTQINNNNYVVFANVVLKVPAANIPFYLSKSSAISGVNPSGKLPDSTTDYFFQSMPVSFNITERSDSYITAFKTQTDFTLKAPGDIILQLNIWLDKSGYTDVYIQYDAAQMILKGCAVKIEDFQLACQKVEDIQNQVENTAASLQQLHNTTLDAMLAPNVTEAALNDYKNTIAATADNILALKKSGLYMVRIAQQCNAQKTDYSPFGSDISICAALQLSVIMHLKNDTAATDVVAASLADNNYASNAALDSIKNVIASNADVSSLTLPASDIAANTNNKKSMWWLLGIGAGLYLLND